MRSTEDVVSVTNLLRFHEEETEYLPKNKGLLQALNGKSNFAHYTGKPQLILRMYVKMFCRQINRKNLVKKQNCFNGMECIE